LQHTNSLRGNGAGVGVRPDPEIEAEAVRAEAKLRSVRRVEAAVAIEGKRLADDAVCEARAAGLHRRPVVHDFERVGVRRPVRGERGAQHGDAHVGGAVAGLPDVIRGQSRVREGARAGAEGDDGEFVVQHGRVAADEIRAQRASEDWCGSKVDAPVARQAADGGLERAVVQIVRAEETQRSELCFDGSRVGEGEAVVGGDAELGGAGAGGLAQRAGVAHGAGDVEGAVDADIAGEAEQAFVVEGAGEVEVARAADLEQSAVVTTAESVLPAAPSTKRLALLWMSSTPPREPD